MTLVGIEPLEDLENPVKSCVEHTRTPFYVIVGKNIEIASFHIFDSRPGRSAHDALKKAQQTLNAGYESAVGIDLERFFDTVNQSYLIEILSHTVKDGRVISLIHKYLYAGVMIDGVYHPTPEGTPQGGPLNGHRTKYV